jgi:hypothetical protein
MQEGLPPLQTTIKRRRRRRRRGRRKRRRVGGRRLARGHLSRQLRIKRGHWIRDTH